MESAEENIADFQELVLQMAIEIKQHRERKGITGTAFWPYIVPDMVKHLPPGVSFDHWKDDDEVSGQRCCQLRYTI